MAKEVRPTIGEDSLKLSEKDARNTRVLFVVGSMAFVHVVGVGVAVVVFSVRFGGGPVCGGGRSRHWRLGWDR